MPSSSFARPALAGACLAVAAALVAGTPASADGLAALRPAPLGLTGLAPPSPVLGSDGRRHVVYELQVSNPAPAAATVLGVVVRDDHRRVVASYGPTEVPSVLVAQAPGAS